jgi:NADH-quinone oxidoreductase subunit N
VATAAVLAYGPGTQALKALVVVAALACLVARRPWPALPAAFEYPMLRLLAVLGRLGLLAAQDLRLVYLALELQSLALYALAAFRRGSAYSTEAGLKYFMLGAFASGLFLLGASLVYGFLGTTSREALERLTAGGLADAVALPVSRGFRLRAVARLFKLAMAPFHRWSPDVMEGSPASSSLFFAAVSKVAMLVILARLAFGPFYALAPLWVNVFAVGAGLSRRMAALAALRQRRLKRFFAYSAMGHSGYRLRGMSCATLEGLSASLRYRAIYVAGSLALWTTLLASQSLAAPSAATGSLGSAAAPALRPATYLTDLGSRGSAAPALAASYAMARFSRAGVPPRSGFLAKLSVLFAAREGGLYGLAFVAMATSMVGAYYYLRIMKIRYFEGVSDTVWAPVAAPAARVIALATFVTVFLRAQPDLLATVCQRAALSFLAG